ncbi:MAG: ABC transporter permease [Sulfolobales archaeon]
MLPRLIPGNPLAMVVFRLTQGSGANPEQLRDVERALISQFNFDKPLHEQFIQYMLGLLRGDLGKSIIFYPLDVSTIISIYLPWTLLLMIPAIVAAWLVGNLIGTLAAMNRGKLVDKIWLPLMMILHSIPPYIFAMYLLLLFAVYLKILPTGGGWPPNMVPSLTPEFIAAYLRHYALPFLSIFLASLGGWGLSMRNIALQEISTDYMDYLRVLAVSGRKTMKYLFRASSLPQVVGLAIVLGWSISGSVITEIVFNYPGLGTLLWRAIQSQDFPLIQGIFIILIGAIITANFVSELIFAIIDPRVRRVYVGE